jgi:hypothetical protein
MFVNIMNYMICLQKCIKNVTMFKMFPTCLQIIKGPFSQPYATYFVWEHMHQFHMPKIHR